MTPSTEITEAQLSEWKKLFLQEFKKPVSVVQYNQRRKKYKRLPPYNQVVKAFGSWTTAMSAFFGESANVYRTNWTKEEMLSSVRQAIQDLGDYPSQTQYEQWREAHPNTPSISTLERRLGPYKTIMYELGQMDYRGISNLTKEEVDTKLKEYFQNPEAPRTFKEYLAYRKAYDLELPSEKMIVKYYDGWRQMLKAFGEQSVKSFKGDPTKPTTLSLHSIESAKQLLAQLEKPISARKYKELRKAQSDPLLYPSYEALKQEYGGWEQALNAFGIEERHPSTRKNTFNLFSEEETRCDLLHYFKIAREPNYLGYVAYARRKNKKTRRIATISEIKKYYGGWEGMLTTLNLQVTPGSYNKVSNKDMIHALKQAAELLGLPLTITKYQKGKQEFEVMKDFPSRETILREFKTWHLALEAAGVEIVKTRNLMKEEFKINTSLSDFLDWCLD